MSKQSPAFLSRRSLLGTGAALGVGVPLAGLGTTSALADDGQHTASGISSASVRAAVGFLQRATDAYRSSGMRLAQSFRDGSGLTDVGYIYDNALTSIALLSIGDVARARAIGDALIYAQNHDETFSDFRLRQAYHVNHFVNQNGTAAFGWEFNAGGTAVGDMSWSGIALAHLARTTRRAKYLEAAVRIGKWIYDWTYSTTGLQGYTFGQTRDLEDHKSTEHNIDVYAFYRLLASLTGDSVWRERAAHAWDFVESVWNPEGGFFWTGSDDGAAINKAPAQLPLDVQTWSWLAAGKAKYAGALDWAAGNLATTDTPLRKNSALTGNYTVNGVAFASGSLITDTDSKIGGKEWNPVPNDTAVWFEGTSQLALALRLRSRPGDKEAAEALLRQVRSAQKNLGKGQTFGDKPAPGGVVAASSALDTGFKFGYFPNRHIGATSWYVFAGTRFNPYR